VFEKTSCTTTPPFNSKIPMLKHTNKSHDMMIIKNNSPFKNPHHYKLHFSSQLLNKMEDYFMPFLKYMQVNISQNINHDLQPPRKKQRHLILKKIK
jgi:hypothetical protein